MWENNVDAMRRRLFGDVAKETGLLFNESTLSLYGKVNGYDLSMTMIGQSCYLQASIRKNGQLPDAKFVADAKKAVSSVRVAKMMGNKICFAMKGGYTDKKQADNVVLAINGLTEFFKVNGYANVCEHCGMETDNISVYGTDGNLSHLCSTCIEAGDRILEEKALAEYDVPENVPAGILGAFLGAVAGAVVIALIGMAGFIASIGGVVLAFATLTLYEKFAKKLSIKGIVICVAIMILTVFAVVHLEWAVDIYDIFKAESDEVSFLAVHQNLFAIISEAGAWGDFIKELVMLYGFTVLGAFPTIKKNYVEKKALTKKLEERNVA